MYQPIMVAPRKSHRTAWIVIGVILGVCCLGGAGTGIWLFTRATSELPHIRAAATTYLDAVRDGDLATAYGQVCQSTRSRMTPDGFAAITHSITDYEITGVSVNNTNGRVRGLVTFRATLTTGPVFQQTIALVKEDGTWRVCDD